MRKALLAVWWTTCTDADEKCNCLPQIHFSMQSVLLRQWAKKKRNFLTSLQRVVVCHLRKVLIEHLLVVWRRIHFTTVCYSHDETLYIVEKLRSAGANLDTWTKRIHCALMKGHLMYEKPTRGSKTKEQHHLRYTQRWKDKKWQRHDTHSVLHFLLADANFEWSRPQFIQVGKQWDSSALWDRINTN